MTPAEVRDRLTHALRLDLIGPDAGEPQVSEILAIAPSRWYLTGFLVPWNAPVSQKQDEEDTQGELELGTCGNIAVAITAGSSTLRRACRQDAAS